MSPEEALEDMDQLGRIYEREGCCIRINRNWFRKKAEVKQSEQETKINVPAYLQPFYKVIKRGNCCVTGQLSCCMNHAFEVNYMGSVQQNRFGRKDFMPGERVVLNAKCSKCLREIPLFDSAADGYDNCIDQLEGNRKSEDEVREKLPFFCDECHHNRYEIKIWYEYPVAEELEDLDIQDRGNCFTAIQISLKCQNCGKSYKNIGFETG